MLEAEDRLFADWAAPITRRDRYFFRSEPPPLALTLSNFWRQRSYLTLGHPALPDGRMAGAVRRFLQLLPGRAPRYWHQ